MLKNPPSTSTRATRPSGPPRATGSRAPAGAPGTSARPGDKQIGLHALGIGTGARRYVIDAVAAAAQGHGF
jgi:hypothetical protein